MDEITKVKITVLFKEYETLRAEIIARVSSGYSLWSLAIAIVGSWILLQEKGSHAWLFLSLAAIVLAGIFASNEHANRKCARRIAAIEQRVNELAGEDLLGWESRCGAVAIGYLGTAPKA